MPPSTPLTKDLLKVAAVGALRRVVDPLVSLMFDTGITVREFSRIVRDRAVRSAAIRVAKETGKASHSRVAIITGLPRSEVARVLSTDEMALESRIGHHPVRKVLAIWHYNHRFLDANGNPAVLPIFGARKSFEQLIASAGGGSPVRAMLDQLNEIGAVEILSGQRVRVKARVPIYRGMTSSAITNFGERTGDLLETLSNNLRTTRTPLFEGTAILNDVDADKAPLVRRQIAEQGLAFIDSANSLLSRSRSKPGRPRSNETRLHRAGVTIFYFEDDPSTEIIPKSSQRKNFRRRSDKKATTRRS